MFNLFHRSIIMFHSVDLAVFLGACMIPIGLAKLASALSSTRDPDQVHVTAATKVKIWLYTRTSLYACAYV